MPTTQISRIEVSNFKSLVDFEMDLPKFVCLIGLNGSGKSTVLQFIDFLSQLVSGDMNGWLSERKWRSSELRSKLTRKVNIEFRVCFSDEKGQDIGSWTAAYSPASHQCVRESIAFGGSLVRTTGKGIEFVHGVNGSAQRVKDWNSPVTFSYEGSILSALKEDLLPPGVLYCKKWLAGIKSLDLLAPERLRQRTRESAGTLGLGGQNLASFLHEMDDDQRRGLVLRLKKVYPRLQELQARSLRSGWKQLEISESLDGQDNMQSIATEARHINDGMLRMIAILAELQSVNNFLLFDEIENGINPELVEFVIDHLVAARQQVLVTTHSPMILNYLEDDVAREGVIYLYKTPKGETKSIRFFSIPSLLEKLEVMGPGEVFADTSLTDLVNEIALMHPGKEE